YKVSGGDAETAEYHVSVRSAPLLTDFDVTYHPRPYLKQADIHAKDPNLSAMRGTDVTLVAHANRPVKSGSIEIIGEDHPIPGELVAGEPSALRFHFVVDKDATYRVWFTTREDERNSDPMPYTIKALQDRPPEVQLTRPGKHVHVPVNGVLTLDG